MSGAGAADASAHSGLTLRQPHRDYHAAVVRLSERGGNLQVAADGQTRLSAPSIGRILLDNRGVGPGFDFLRLALALSIVLAHSYQIATGAVGVAEAQPFWLVVYLQVPMFFALSGFLVAGSASRLSLSNFLLNRAFRIYPALIAEIVLSIFIIGLVFTRVGWAEFFASGKFWLYLTNLFGLPHYQLPGVFADNPLRYKVNGSLWTVPYELVCYLIMSLLIVTGLVRNSARMLAFAAAAAIFGAEPLIWYHVLGVAALQHANSATIYVYENILNPNFTMTFAYFSWGVAAYQVRDRVPYSRALAALCVGLVVLIGLYGAAYEKEAWFKLAMLPVGVYLTLFIGLTRIPLPRFLTSGDYSYGVYLYGFPVQQAVQACLGGATSMWLNFGLAAPIIFLWSKFSWAFVEKPALGLRKKIARRATPAPAPPLAAAASAPVPVRRAA